MNSWGSGARNLARSISSAGRLVAATGLCAWIVGRQLGWREGMWIAAACLVVFAVGLLFLYGSTDIEIDVNVDPTRVTVGDPAGGSLTVRNTGRRRLLPLRVELAVGRGTSTFDIPSLHAGEKHNDLFILPTSRRQVILVGPATSVRGDPLGLTRRAVDWTTPVPVYVHPRVARLDNLGSGFLRDLEGQPTTDLSSNDVAFHTLREYVPGDDRRFIHWKTTARVGDYMVRQFVDTRRSHLAILVDTRPSSYVDDGELELGISLAASLGVRALIDNQEVTLSAGDGPLASANGQQLLDALAGIVASHRHQELAAQAARVSAAGAGVTIAAMVTGSVLPLADVRSAMKRFDGSIRGFVVRADRKGCTGVRPMGNSTILNVEALDRFGFIMWKLSRW